MDKDPGRYFVACVCAVRFTQYATICSSKKCFGGNIMLSRFSFFNLSNKTLMLYLSVFTANIFQYSVLWQLNGDVCWSELHDDNVDLGFDNE